MLNSAIDHTINRWLAFTVPGERIFILYLGTAIIMAFFAWLHYRHQEKKLRPEGVDKSFLSYIFSRNILFHRSAIQDYIFFFVNGFIYIGILTQLLLSAHLFFLFFHGTLESVFGKDGALLEPSVAISVLYTIIYVLLFDFAVFITHYAQHKIPILWEFHKLHHSAEVLTPITVYRMHPVDLFFTSVIGAILVGLGFAVFYYLIGEEPHAYEIMGVNILVFTYYLLGYNLRHSRVWLNYPGWLSNILISPAHHQIHHSSARQHWDKNMGLIFAFWDKIFGTLYTPKSYEKITYGIAKNNLNPFGNIFDMYLQPFRKAWKLIYTGKKPLEHALTFLGLCLFGAVCYAAFFSLDLQARAQDAALPSVQIEDLTWTEVHKAVTKNGYNTIIIPTGGTEQNGPHVILGKHNYIVRHNAAEIAKRRGDMLVAPVISYVPEDVHMDWAGTVSISEKLFTDLLKSAAESYIKHGFKNILFIGDSGGNQDGQKQAAEALNKKYENDNIIIAHISDYYSANGQTDWLLDHSYTQEEIGGHAGIRDTSEMKFIHPAGVRRYPVIIEDHDLGYNGDPELANRWTGKTMTNLKIDAALKQIETVLGPPSKQQEHSSEKTYYEP